MSNLQHYLTSNNIRQADFAAEVGATQGTISKLINGGMPSLLLASKIERATGGEVTASSWYREDDDLPPEASAPTAPAEDVV